MVYFKILIMALTLFVVPFALGIAGKIIFRSNKLKTSIVRTYTDGFLMWLSIYQILEVPMVLVGASLDALTISWVLITILFIVISIIFGRKQYEVVLKQFKEGFTTWSSFKALAFVMMAIIFVMAVFFDTGLATDDAFYFGASTDAVSTNTMWKYEPYTGREEVKLNAKYAFTGYPMFVATLSKLFKLNVSIVTHIVMCIWCLVIIWLSCYLLSSVIFKEKWQRWALICVMCAFIIAGNYSMGSSSTFVIIAPWLGKTWFAKASIPLVMYYAVLAMGNEKSKLKLNNRAGLFWAVTVSTFFSSTSVILMPFFMAVLCAYYSIVNKTVQNILPVLTALIPTIVVGAIYLMFQM